MEVSDLADRMANGIVLLAGGRPPPWYMRTGSSSGCRPGACQGFDPIPKDDNEIRLPVQKLPGDAFNAPAQPYRLLVGLSQSACMATRKVSGQPSCSTMRPVWPNRLSKCIPVMHA